MAHDPLLTTLLDLDARAIAQAHFIAADGVGRLRILEHALFSPSLDLEQLASELSALLR